ncbi:MAG: hydrolase [Clostridiales bacterium]|nr:hydrolase [Clostridiales bacterium]
MKIELMIQNDSTLITPCVEVGIEWYTERKGSPGKLTFSVLRDDLLNIEEGNPVKLRVDGIDVFYGFIFRFARDKNPIVKVTAYDQMRYLKNKDTYVFEKSTASDIIKMISDDYGIRLGNIENTGYVIPSRVEENSTLLDMMQTVLNITLTNTKRLYVLYDNAGLLTLASADTLRVGLIIDVETGENYNYVSTIDDSTYNRIKLVYEDEKSGKRQIFTAQDRETMGKWGTLQYYEDISDTLNAQNKADSLLVLYNAKTKTLKITGAFGDLRIRAGKMIIVRLNLGDTVLNHFMMVEHCKHYFNNDEHSMDLTLRGGEFIG